MKDLKPMSTESSVILKEFYDLASGHEKKTLIISYISHSIECRVMDTSGLNYQLFEFIYYMHRDNSYKMPQYRFIIKEGKFYPIYMFTDFPLVIKWELIGSYTDNPEIDEQERLHYLELLNAAEQLVIDATEDKDKAQETKHPAGAFFINWEM